MIKEKLTMSNGESLEISYDVEDLLKIYSQHILTSDHIKNIFICHNEEIDSATQTLREKLGVKIKNLPTDLSFLLDEKQKDDIAAKKFRDEHTAVMKGDNICVVVDCENVANKDNILISNVVMEGAILNKNMENKVCNDCKEKIIKEHSYTIYVEKLSNI